MNRNDIKMILSILAVAAAFALLGWLFNHFVYP